MREAELHPAEVGTELDVTARIGARGLPGERPQDHVEDTTLPGSFRPEDQERMDTGQVQVK
jgi:hypothetical protein